MSGNFLTHLTKLGCPFERLSLIGLLPDNSSRTTTPNAYTSTFSLTIPLIKYSGAMYPKVPTIFPVTPETESLDPHMAKPKSDNYTEIENKLGRKLMNQIDTF